MLGSLLLIATLAVQLTPAEVALHDSPADCWLIIDGQVYDATPFIAAHPGGDAITRGCGKDASLLFANRDAKGGHSEGAHALLATLRVGAVGEQLDQTYTSPEPPPSPRLAPTRLGHQATADVGPKSINLRVGHTIATRADQASGIALQAGYSTGKFDIVVSDEQSAGIGSLEAKAKLLDQGGEKPRPLSLAVLAGGGMGYSAGAPAVYGQVIAQRAALDGRLFVRANGTASVSPGAEGSAAASAGLSVEFVPMPLHGVFFSLQSPFEDPAAVVWNAGLSFYTRQHTFALYAASTPSLHPVALTRPVEPGLAIGLSLERAFLLDR